MGTQILGLTYQHDESSTITISDGSPWLIFTTIFKSLISEPHQQRLSAPVICNLESLQSLALKIYSTCCIDQDNCVIGKDVDPFGCELSDAQAPIGQQWSGTP
jgi:hypothetical protein